MEPNGPETCRPGKVVDLRPLGSRLAEAGSGGVQDKEKVLLAEILSRVNDLLQGDLIDDDQRIYTNGVICGKLLENKTLVQQSGHNSKEQFSAPPLAAAGHGRRDHRSPSRTCCHEQADPRLFGSSRRIDRRPAWPRTAL